MFTPENMGVYNVIKPVAERGGGLGGGQCPQQEIKLKLCPTKLRFALAYFNHYLPKLQITLLHFNGNVLFEEKN